MVDRQSIQVDPELDIQRLIQGYTNSGVRTATLSATVKRRVGWKSIRTCKPDLLDLRNPFSTVLLFYSPSIRQKIETE